MPDFAPALAQGLPGFLSLIWWFFTQSFGWVILFIMLDVGLVYLYLIWIRILYKAKHEYVLLAIDVPLENEQGPTAIENLFQHLSGIHETYDWFDFWWDGRTQTSLSFEIVSIGGYIQFLVRTHVKFRDLIESVFYGQYPDCRITEVEDYTKKWDGVKFPHPDYEVWCLELIQRTKDVYPIKTYEKFIDKGTNDFKDPMASLLEVMSKIRPGEEIWVQFVLTAADNDWSDYGHSLVQKLAGGKPAVKKNIFDALLFGPIEFLISLVSSAFNPPPASNSGQSEPPNLMLYLTPGEREILESIERKMGKVGFHTRMRAVYIGPKGVHKGSAFGLKSIYGSFKQFNTINMNGLKLNSRTYPGTPVFFSKLRGKWRKNLIVREFKDRGHSLTPGWYGKILNTEELATLYHFPVKEVKAPQLMTTDSRKAEPPISLPTDVIVPVATESSSAAEEPAAEEAGPPDNLPLA